MGRLVNRIRLINSVLVITLVALSFLGVHACQSIANTINGESKPKLENLESIREFIAETNLAVDPYRQLYLLDGSSKEFLLTLKSNNPGKEVTIPNCYLFDKDFKLLDNYKLGGCITDRPKIEGKDFYEELIRANESTTSEQSLTDWKGFFVDYNRKDYFPFKKSGRAIAVIAWAKFKGKMWADTVNYMIWQIQQSKTPIDIYILNMDRYEL